MQYFVGIDARHVQDSEQKLVIYFDPKIFGNTINTTQKISCSIITLAPAVTKWNA